MPFQAIPIAFKDNPGSPLAKLVWIHLVDRAQLGGAPNGKAYAQVELQEVARFAQATVDEVRDALQQLERCNLASVMGDATGTLFIDLELPVSQLTSDERRRVKVSPDQMSEAHDAAGYRCAGCGLIDYEYDGWHVDHIIPRSVGGADVERNLQPLCPQCNSRKGNRVHWIDFIGGRRD